MKWLRRLPLMRRIATVAFLSLVCMLAAFGSLYANLSRFENVNKSTQADWEIANKSQDLLMMLVDMETGVRGYVITRNPVFLEPYTHGADHYSDDLKLLEELVQGKPEQQERVARLRTLIEPLVFDVWQRAITLTREGGDAAGLISSQRGKLTMDQLRVLISAINHAQNAVTTRQDEIANDALAATYAWTLGLAAAAIGWGLIATVMLARSVTEPVQALIGAIQRIEEGEAGHTLPLDSHDEVGRLTAGFNRMSAHLMWHMEENAAQQEELTAQNEELAAQQESLNHSMEQLERERGYLEALNSFTRHVMGAQDVGQFASIVLEHLMRRGLAEVGAVCILTPGGGMRVAASAGVTREATTADRLSGFLKRVADSGEPFSVQYPASALLRPVYHTELPVEHELYLPVSYGGETLAVVVLGRTGPTAFQADLVNWLAFKASQAGAAVSNLLAYEKLSHTTEELQIERDRAHAQRDTLNAVLGTTSEGFCMLDTAGRIVLANDRLWELLAMTPRENMTLADFAVLGPRLGHPVSDPEMQKVFAHPNSDLTHTSIIEIAQPRAINLQVFSAPVYGACDRRLGRLFVLRDVTRETEVDRMKTEFISTVSHELRTPLTSIRGFVDLILDGDAGPVSDEQREFLELVSQSTVRLANLINDLLDVEKIEQGRIEMRVEAVDLSNVLDHVVRVFQVFASEKGLTLDLQIEGPLPAVSGDVDRLTQVFTNLVSNAVKYTKQGSVIVRAAARGGAVTVDVVDTGIGMSSESQEQLFTKFFRVDNEYTREVGGAGLGLAITRLLVERHSGQIEIQSSPGVGSTFTVTLPAQDPTPPSVSDPLLTPALDLPVRQAAAAVAEGSLVLIVEDDVAVSRLISEHIARLGLRSAVAQTGPEGLAKARDLKPDLITLDVLLPGMDGWEVISHLKRDPATAGIPVVFMSILAESSMGLRRGADAFLTKPIDPRALGETVRRLLAREKGTALLAVRPEHFPETRLAVERSGCTAIAAHQHWDLPSQVIATSADLVLLDRGWYDGPVSDLIGQLRDAPGLQHLPVLLLGEGVAAEMAPAPAVLGAVDAKVDPEELSREILHYLSQRKTDR